MRTKNPLKRLPNGAKTKIYQIWQNMRGRCLNENDAAYINYGGRGIRVCERWAIFENFLADMGEPPPGMTLEREDNDGDYCPENCRWATRAEQARNTRQNHWIEFDGRKQILNDWATEIGIKREALRERLKTMSISDALTMPLQNQTKLTEAQISEIRSFPRKYGDGQKLAERYGVPIRFIRAVLYRKVSVE